VIDVIVKKILDDEKKMIVLRLLGDQMKLLLQTGRTNTDSFRNGLEMQELASPQATFTASFTQLQEIQTSATGSELVVKSTNYRFPITSLQLLNERQWINQDIILACLHSADRLPFIRVGCFHIALSDQLKDPLQMMQKKVRQWRRQIDKENYLVYLFPLNHNGCHWSLLEIDDREHLITHYNGPERYIKVESYLNIIAIVLITD
jgi:Ulp1 family protease